MINTLLKIGTEYIKEYIAQFVCENQTIGNILNRNSHIINEINVNQLNSHFNFNRKNHGKQHNDLSESDKKSLSNFYW